MTDIFSKRLREICDLYLDVLCEYIIKYEALENDFPVGVTNEIRAAFTHLAKMVKYEDIVNKEKELENVEKHIKRAIRDCYKYNCISYERRYSVFHNDFVKGVYDDGALIKIENEHDEAIEHLILARTREVNIKENDDSDVDKEEYDNYKKAIAHFETMYSLIHSKYKNN